jgi:hypothetical protein
LPETIKQRVGVVEVDLSISFFWGNYTQFLKVLKKNKRVKGGGNISNLNF